MMTLTFGVLLVLWVAVQNSGPTITGTITGTDAGTDTGADTATDAGPGTLSPHEREEAAKDELARVRAALERGDLAEAAAGLDRASAFDPNNPAITELRQQVLAAQPDGG